MILGIGIKQPNIMNARSSWIQKGKIRVKSRRYSRFEGPAIGSKATYEHSLSLDPNLQIAHKELADLLCGTGDAMRQSFITKQRYAFNPTFERQNRIWTSHVL